MSLTKYASLEVGEILDIKGSPERAKTANLSKIAEFEDYRTEDGYLYARIRAISSRVNKNNDGWPSVELAGGKESWDRLSAQRESSQSGFVVEADAKQKYGYSTFLGKPVFVDHHNSDPKKARGVIVDAKLHVEDHKTASDLDPYYASAPEEHMPPTWVELLLEVDATSFPKLAQAIVEGSEDPNKGIDGFSMGCDVEKSVCSICKNAASSPDEYCNHVKLKGATFDAYDDIGNKTSRKAYEDCYGVKFFEISAVFDPADETALLREIRSSVEKEAGGFSGPLTEGEEVSHLGPTPGKSEPGRAFILKREGDRILIEDNKGNQYWTSEAQLGESADTQDFLVHNFRQELDRNIPTIEHPHGPITGKVASTKTAEGTIPQNDLTKAPEEVDTLRKERVCPVCGQDIDSTECDVCGFEPPPEGLDNPDLTKAQEHQERTDEDDIAAEVGVDIGGPSEPGVQDTSPLRARSARLKTRNSNQTKKVTSDMAWEPKITPRIAALIQADTEGDEPQEEVVKDESKPTTARQIIERNQENDMSDTKVAAEPADSSGKPDKQVDVEGVGGVTDASNEQASQADKQVDVEGKGGTGVEDVSPDETQSVADTADDNAGFDKKKNTQDSGPTKTFPNKNQTSPVTDKAFPTAAKQGTDPVDPVGKPDERVDVEQEVSVSWNQSDSGTDQWTGTDGNGVTKQVNPVTPQVGPGNDVRSSAVLFAAFKLADQEVDLGLIGKDEKYARISELERKSPEALRELHAYLGKIKTAGLSRQTREAHRLPSLSPKSASVETPEPVDQQREDSALFG